MMKIKMKSDFTILDGGMRRLQPMVEKTMSESVESIINRIRYNWSSASPSSPGQPPAVVSGNLDESIKSDNTGRSSAGQFAKGSDISMWFIRVEADYGAALEYGDPSKNLAPRPYIAPAVLAEQEDIGSKFTIGFNGVWRG